MPIAHVSNGAAFCPAGTGSCLLRLQGVRLWLSLDLQGANSSAFRHSEDCLVSITVLIEKHKPDYVQLP